jgi:hypothetical protein
MDEAKRMTKPSTWDDPYAGWEDDLRGKKVLITVRHADTITGFVVGTVNHQIDDVLFVSLGDDEIEVHAQYIHRVLMDDEPIPETLEGLTRLN